MKYFVFIFSFSMFLACTPKDDKAAMHPEGLAAVFFDIDTTEITGADLGNPDRYDQTYHHLDLKASEVFWPGHENFFMHMLGDLQVEEAGKYYLRFTSSGKVVFRINNIEKARVNEPTEDVITESTADLVKGRNQIEIEYFDGKLTPQLKLEWSRDGEHYERVPAEAIVPVQLSLPAQEYADAYARYETYRETHPVADNTLTSEEVQDGWELLFDGESTTGWHTFNHNGEIGRKWRADNGDLLFEGRKRFTYEFMGRQFEFGHVDKVADGGRDICSDLSFDNYELKLDWKISHGGNSGIFYMAVEDPKYTEAWNTSPEMQILDDNVHKDGLIYKHRAGDLYDLIACNPLTVAPQGSWNSIHVKVNQGKIEHWQNGALVVQFDTRSQAWADMIAASKFSTLENYAKGETYHVALQDHDNEVRFRNIKIKRL